MLCTLVLLLNVALNVLQCEGNNQTLLDRPKRRLGEDVIKSIILQNEMEKNSKLQSEDCRKSNLYESILKDIGDIAFLKKNEVDDCENMAQSTSECRESYDKEENDPLTTKFYTFSKASADDAKPFSWIDLLTSPIVQSGGKPKDTDFIQRNKVISPSYDKFHMGDTTKEGYIDILKDQFSSKKDIDDVSLNNILQLFATLGNRNNDEKKHSGRETDVGYLNRVLSSNGINDVTENKLSSSCLVENKSNYFKTDHGPYNRVITDLSALDLLGRVNAAIGNYSSGVGRLDKMEYPINNNFPFLVKENINNPDSPTLTNNQYSTHYKALQWPDIKKHRFNIYNFSKTGPGMDRGNMPPKVESVQSKKKNYYFDVLEDISLDEPKNNSSLPPNDLQNIKQSINTSYLQTKFMGSNGEMQQSLQPSTIIDNASNMNKSATSTNINHANLQNLIRSPDTLEKICLLDKIINTNKYTDHNKYNNYLSSGAISLSPSSKHSLESKFIDGKNNMRALTNYLISHKILNSHATVPVNKTINQPSNTDRKWNVSSTEIHLGPRPESIINKTAPAIMSIGEQQTPIPTDLKPGSQRITLPEYEKMDLDEETTKYPNFLSSSTDVSYESVSTTTMAHIENASVLPLATHTEPSNTLHRNMIPVIDFLGQMWNNSNRKTPGVNWRNSPGDCGGYVIVPLPENSMLQGWKHFEKTTPINKEEFSDSGIVTGFPNVSISQMMTPSNRDLLEKFILKRLFDSFRVSLIPKKRSRRSEPALEDVEDSHSHDHNTTPSSPQHSSQLPPTDKWTMNSSARPAYANTSSAPE